MAYRKQRESSMFEQEFTLEELTRLGDPLPRLKEIIDFERFHPILEPVFENKDRKSNAGRRPLDPVLMMKVLFLQLHIVCSYGALCSLAWLRENVECQRHSLCVTQGFIPVFIA